MLHLNIQLQKTKFTWNKVQNATRYDLKIWNGEVWVGEAYHIEWGINGNSYEIQLPAGNYEAYLDAIVDNDICMSNVVKFTVKNGSPLEVKTGVSTSKNKIYME